MNTRIPVEILTNSNVVTTDNITTTISNFTGATESSNGTSGFVPAPTIGQQNSFLKGDGTWSNDVSNVDQSVSTANNNYPLLLSSVADATTSQGSKPSIFASTIKANPSASTITAVTFNGALSGNASTATKLAAGKNIDGISFDGSDSITHYITCDTSGSTAAKTTGTLTGFTLSNGAHILVKFSNTNTASNPTLQVGSTTAKSIYVNGAAVEPYYIQGGCIYEFLYNGTQWEMVNGKCSVKFTSTDPGTSTTPPTDLAEGGILIYTPAS